MKTRNDFVSNSSSTSFILKNDEDKSRYQKAFYNHKIISVKQLIDLFTKVKNNLDSSFKDLENIAGDRYNEGRMFEGTFNCLEDTMNSIKEDLENLQEISKSGDEVYITEPTDRDYAYERCISDLDSFAGDL